MKKTINLFLALAATFAVTAQCPEKEDREPKASDVTSAYSNCSLGAADNDPVRAAVFIENAILHEKKKTDAKTWVYRGDIYYIMANMEENPCPEALSKSRDSYVKAKELDKKGTRSDEIAIGLGNLSALAYNTGLVGYNSKDYASSAEKFELAAQLKEDAGATADSLYMYSLFNSGLSYESAGNQSKAIELYEKCAETGYDAKQCYFRIIGTLQASDDLEGSLNYIKKGKEMFPEEPEFLIQETNYYLKSKEFEKAEGNLKQAIENDPNNAMLHFVLGTAMDQLEKTEGAVSAYKKAIEIDPGYLDAYHNLGASYVNASVSINEKINELDFRSNRGEIDQLEAESKVALESALPYLEKALELEPTNVQVMNSLKTIYFSFERMDDYNAMKAKIDALK